MWVAREASVFKPTNPRFSFTDQFTRTNFAFGDDADGLRSTYLHDYTNDYLPAIVSADGRSQQGGDNHKEYEKRKVVLQKTNFTFGNDSKEDQTTYQGFTRHFPNGEINRRRPCTPPKLAQILPLPVEKQWRSTIRNDYAHFGREVRADCHTDRMGELDRIKAVHSRDCVGQSLLGKRRRMLTRSMVDYRHPTEQTVRDSIKMMMVQNISPSVRQDSIWMSVNEGGSNKLISQAGDCFKWPLKQEGIKRFYRGHANKVR